MKCKYCDTEMKRNYQQQRYECQCCGYRQPFKSKNEMDYTERLNLDESY